jgi:hypothetical protein
MERILTINTIKIDFFKLNFINTDSIIHDFTQVLSI